jgi:hypothetical protein
MRGEKMTILKGKNCCGEEREGEKIERAVTLVML